MDKEEIPSLFKHLEKTNRGFGIINFEDSYGVGCSLQESSNGSETSVWLGVSKANPLVMASMAAGYGVFTPETTGWVPYPIPDDVLLHTRMHLTQDMVKQMLPTLQHFAETGELEIK